MAFKMRISSCHTGMLQWLTFSKKLFIYLFMAALGLRCCAWAFSSCGEQLLFTVVRRLLVAVASLVVEHGL